MAANYLLSKNNTNKCYKPGVFVNAAVELVSFLYYCKYMDSCCQGKLTTLRKTEHILNSFSFEKQKPEQIIMNLAVEIGQVVVYKSLTCYYLFHLYFLLCHKKTKKSFS